MYKFYKPVSKRCNLSLTDKLVMIDDPEKEITLGWLIQEGSK